MIRVLLVDDQIFMCQMLQDWLSEEHDFKIVGYANNGEKALELIEELNPNIIIMDVEMPEMDGVTTTEIVSQRFPKVSVIIFSGNDSYENLASALQVGAKGYILKGAEKEEIVQIIRSVHKGYSQLEPRLIEKIFEISQEGKRLKEYVEEARAMLEDTGRIQKRLQENYKKLQTEFISELNQLKEELTSVKGEAEVVSKNFVQLNEKLTNNSLELARLRKYLIVTGVTLLIVIIILIF